MKADEMVNLLYSPQWVAKLLYFFISGASKTTQKGVKLELIYLLLPFIFDELIFKKLCANKSTSTFSSTFQENVLKNSLVHKANQIEVFRDITNRGFIYLCNQVEIKITNFIAQKFLKTIK